MMLLVLLFLVNFSRQQDVASGDGATCFDTCPFGVGPWLLHGCIEHQEQGSPCFCATTDGGQHACLGGGDECRFVECPVDGQSKACTFKDAQHGCVCDFDGRTRCLLANGKGGVGTLTTSSTTSSSTTSTSTTSSTSSTTAPPCFDTCAFGRGDHILHGGCIEHMEAGSPCYCETSDGATHACLGSGDECRFVQCPLQGEGCRFVDADTGCVCTEHSAVRCTLPNGKGGGNATHHAPCLSNLCPFGLFATADGCQPHMELGSPCVCTSSDGSQVACSNDVATACRWSQCPTGGSCVFFNGCVCASDRKTACTLSNGKGASGCPRSCPFGEGDDVAPCRKIGDGAGVCACRRRDGNADEVACATNTIDACEHVECPLGGGGGICRFKSSEAGCVCQEDNATPCRLRKSTTKTTTTTTTMTLKTDKPQSPSDNPSRQGGSNAQAQGETESASGVAGVVLVLLVIVGIVVICCCLGGGALLLFFLMNNNNKQSGGGGGGGGSGYNRSSMHRRGAALSSSSHNARRSRRSTARGSTYTAPLRSLRTTQAEWQ